MQNNKKDWTYISVFTFTIIIIVLSMFYITYFDKFIKIPECVILKTFGIYCPGCGATRAVYSLYKSNTVPYWLTKEENEALSNNNMNFNVENDISIIFVVNSCKTGCVFIEFCFVDCYLFLLNCIYLFN